jgi:hypothetical protein
MTTITLSLDSELSMALDALCAERGHDKGTLITDIVRKYVETERLKRALQDPALLTLYQELAAEDLALAEEGMAEYQQIVNEADRS